MDKAKVYVLYSYGSKDESVWVLGAFYNKENAEKKLKELADAEKNGRLYYIQETVFDDLEIKEV